MKYDSVIKRNEARIPAAVDELGMFPVRRNKDKSGSRQTGQNEPPQFFETKVHSAPSGTRNAACHLQGHQWPGEQREGPGRVKMHIAFLTRLSCLFVCLFSLTKRSPGCCKLLINFQSSDKIDSDGCCQFSSLLLWRNGLLDFPILPLLPTSLPYVLFCHGILPLPHQEMKSSSSPLGSGLALVTQL